MALSKRLLNAFSFKPTVIYHMPFDTSVKVLYNGNPYQQLIRPIVTNTSLIHLSPPPFYNNTNAPKKISLSSGIKQQQLIIEHGRLQRTDTFVVHSNGVIFFHVDRRQTKLYDHKLASTTLANIDLNFVSGIPYSVISSYDTISEVLVDVKDIMNINNRDYHLRTVVIAETLKLQNGREAIINSSTLFNDKKNIKANMIGCTWYRYDPIGLNNDNITMLQNSPIAAINGNKNIQSSMDINDLLEKRGLIYIYELDGNINSNIPVIFP
jgi:hypothetical protein